MTIDEIKTNIADNLSSLRQSLGMTQVQLAEKMNYSDKAISKWERAESVPDVAILKQLADLFGVSVDWLIAPHSGDVPAPEASGVTSRRHNQLQISLLSAVGVLFIVALVFAVLWIVGVPHAWLVFLWAVPSVATDLLVFNAIWGVYRRNFIFISVMIWTFLAALYVTLGVLTGAWGLWYLFFFGVLLQCATVFWSEIRTSR